MEELKGAVNVCVHSVIIPSWWVDFPHATLSTNCGKVVNEAPNYPNSTEGSGYLSLTLSGALFQSTQPLEPL